MSFQNLKNNNMSQAKRTTIEDAIRAANLGTNSPHFLFNNSTDNYSFSKKENEGQNQSATKQSAKSIAPKGTLSLYMTKSNLERFS
jgi:hypothetical protein